ncbi:hypothetical protein SKAU_G00125620 [Synaphobranchus kaupii]|uniref:Uncharacterized protein n=1 Tax=Synaphobranchus kaupii TaxID=118154 RepID=A0A9Q1FPD9_SYNKA|nr:hypothetical protein SKAU_G00125620 [Synaphobranchus kaupii]
MILVTMRPTVPVELTNEKQRDLKRINTDNMWRTALPCLSILFPMRAAVELQSEALGVAVCDYTSWTYLYKTPAADVIKEV